MTRAIIQQSKYRFIRKTTTYAEDNALRKFSYIALVDTTTGAIAEVTAYGEYALYRYERDMLFLSSDNGSLDAVCQFLNYVIIDNYDRYGIQSVTEVKVSMLADFLSAYIAGEINGVVSTNTIKKKRAAISNFLESLAHDESVHMQYIHVGDLIQYYSFTTSDHIRIVKPRYTLPLRFVDRGNPIPKLNRDMPPALIDRFVTLANEHDPEITFAIVLMAYAGLRIGEVCNMHRRGGSYSPSLRFTYGQPQVVIVNGIAESKQTCTAIDIDLNDTLVLRSDGKSVGEIKRERLQPVHGECIKYIFSAYQSHIAQIKNKECENTNPMFLCQRRDRSTGKYMALTRDALRERIKRLFWNYVLPSCERDSNPDLQQFYYQMQDHTWGPHAFRHWFSVFLVVECKADHPTLQKMRGDRNPNSSLPYIEGKGVFGRTYHLASELEGKRIYNSDDCGEDDDE